MGCRQWFFHWRAPHFGLDPDSPQVRHQKVQASELKVTPEDMADRFCMVDGSLSFFPNLLARIAICAFQLADWHEQ